MPVNSLARRLLSELEPVATFPWFSPEFFEEMAAAGFPGWSGYFCSRAAPFGAISADVAIAAFYNWNPVMIRRELQWSETATPEVAFAAYQRCASRVFDRVLTDVVSAAQVQRCVELLREAAAACPLEGRPVFAAWASMPWPTEPPVALVHAAHLLREFRGDTHNAILVSHGLGPIEALLLNGAFVRVSDAAKYLGSREWTLDDAKPAIEALVARSLLTPEAALTDGGGKFREMVELDTDRRSTAPVVALGIDRAEELLSLLAPLAAKIMETKSVPGIIGRVGGRT